MTKVIADGAYDSRRNIRFLSNCSIELPIKMKASTKARECMPSKLSVIEQKEDLDVWKENHECGYRWTAESVFSAFKRILGEHVKAV